MVRARKKVIKIHLISPTFRLARIYSSGRIFLSIVQESSSLSHISLNLGIRTLRVYLLHPGCTASYRDICFYPDEYLLVHSLIFNIMLELV